MTLDSNHSEGNAAELDEDEEDDDDEAVDLEEFEARGCFDDEVRVKKGFSFSIIIYLC